MDTHIAPVERLFQALGDATRLRILGLLLTGEVCVCHIYESLRISQPKASRHLAYLRRAGLVETRRHGVWIYYRLAVTDDPLLQTIQQAVTHALAHLPVVQQDGRRLQKKTGCCLPAADAPAFACCSAGTDRPAIASTPSVLKTQDYGSNRRTRRDSE